MDIFFVWTMCGDRSAPGESPTWTTQFLKESFANKLRPPLVCLRGARGVINTEAARIDKQCGKMTL
eukprot:6616630-Pyramimonas_sp.AAC.1